MAQGLLVQIKEKVPAFITKVKQEGLDLTVRNIGIQELIHGFKCLINRHYRIIDTFYMRLAFSKYCRKNTESLETQTGTNSGVK